eukprot:TRINITY_DN11222_c0_g3_i2.p1 TRINITY_DN11222_c0_g3~~TRINITY_DN11222_c0_g3_i2.p1  ORF type:complete len:223 (+),score=16.62 TRINITY_DN11222_c0_g3_i2:144-812(+)
MPLRRSSHWVATCACTSTAHWRGWTGMVVSWLDPTTDERQEQLLSLREARHQAKTVADLVTSVLDDINAIQQKYGWRVIDLTCIAAVVWDHASGNLGALQGFWKVLVMEINATLRAEGRSKIVVKPLHCVGCVDHLHSSPSCMIPLCVLSSSPCPATISAKSKELILLLDDRQSSPSCVPGVSCSATTYYLSQEMLNMVHQLLANISVSCKAFFSNTVTQSF